MLGTSRIAALMLTILVSNSGCGQSGTSATDAINHEPLLQLSAKADQRVGKTQNDPVGLLKGPLAAFLKEDPRKCDSPALQKAVNSSLQIGGGLDTKYGTPDIKEIGAVMLDVADAANDAGCAKIARQLYDFVVDLFSGPSYPALRQRAELGIGALQQRH